MTVNLKNPFYDENCAPCNAGIALVMLTDTLKLLYLIRQIYSCVCAKESDSHPPKVNYSKNT